VREEFNQTQLYISLTA